MTAFQLLPSLMTRPAWTPVQAERAHARMLRPWQAYLQQCHGLWGLELSDTALTLSSLRMAHIRRWSDAFQASKRAWPIQPASLDLIVWRVSAEDVACLPAIMSQMAMSLGPAARILVWVEAPLLNSWCQIGMPLCGGHDWALREAAWGDARALTLLPTALAKRWSATLQLWAPYGAQWSVQLWQRETICPIAPGTKRPMKKQKVANLDWQPQSSIDHSK